ncbi:non-homologous end joining protein Ku [Roseomonas marmotae]|uniref:Non-homologous end joining protein Ku n=1 Tax=Roseomonas marmotae TaxID=2768161 RepID=A0ABS3KHP3_9PROT|nr:Ku protein [Roseomonas marmotae]MBO1075831.1 Ku protein [Roseomonas marmotae]
MSDRPIWRGTLRLALVSCRIALLTARHERNNLHFHLINPDTGHRIHTQAVDAETGQAVERSELARGYEVEKGRYVVLTDEDFDSARVESSSTLSIAKFVPAGSVGPLYFDSSYYLVPDGEEGADVYAVLREALQESGMMALSRLVLFRRERAVGILPLGRGLVLHTLHEESDLRPAASAFEDLPKATPDKEMVKLARQLIERQVGEFDPADTEDRYEARLREVIEARKEGLEPEPEPEEQPDRGNVIDLMAALLNSLKQGEPRKAPARKPPARKASPSRRSKPAPKKRA